MECQRQHHLRLTTFSLRCMNADHVQTKMFAKMLCDDLDIPQSCAPIITSAMDEQIAECAPFAEYYPTDRRVVIRLDVRASVYMLLGTGVGDPCVAVARWQGAVAGPV